MRGVVRLVVLLAMMWWSLSASAVNPDERLGDPALEERARQISRELRCLQCQNQSIDDSDAGYAKDMRFLVRERLEAGDSDAEVIDFVVNRYGEFALFRPRFSGQNLMLWLGPGVLFLVAATVLAVRLRKSPAQVRTADRLSDDELAKVEQILEEHSSQRKSAD